MERQLKSRQARAQTLLAGMPDVPEDVRQRFATAFLIKDPAPRGMPKALQAFYAHMRAVRRVPAQVRADDFIALSASRTAHRVLLGALRQFAPEVPLAAARTVSKHWDHWLNSTYNKKPRSRRVSTRVALLPDDWPAAWQVGCHCSNKWYALKASACAHSRRRHGKISCKQWACLLHRAFGLRQGVL